ncbi:binding-protein-dependent transporter [Allostella vacuolata]|nr:binding-protein-dependent transporter [Stella vacuolata]
MARDAEAATGSGRRKRGLRAALATFGMIAALAGSVGAEAKTLRWAHSNDATTMDPYGAYIPVNASLLNNIYEPLVRYDRQYRFEASLATEWTMLAPDRWRFALRRGVTFHDGNPFTADDVVASLKRASDPNSPYRPATQMIKDVVAIDDHTVEIVLQGPYPILLNDLAGVYIMDRQWMEKNDALRSINPAKGEESFATRNTNGTGPFRLVSRRPDVETVMEANPDWWDKPEHNISRIVYRPLAADATRVAALLSGEVDLVTPIAVQDVDRIRRTPELKVIEVPDLKVALFGLNIGGAELNDSDVKGKNPLADVRVRQALYQALDREAITRRLLRGLTQPTHALVAAEIQGYDPAIAAEPAPFDPDAAKRLLAEAGYPDGFRVGFDCPTERFVNGEQVCQAVVGMWARIGVKAAFQTHPYAPYLKKVLNGQADIYILGWANTPQLDAFSILNNVFHTKAPRSGTWNPGKYGNAEVDALVDRIGVEVDRSRRLGLMKDAFLKIKADYAALPLYREPLVLGARQNVDIWAAPDAKVRVWLARIR